MSEWGGLGAIRREAAALDEEAERRGEIACPRCGTPLQFRRGEGNCPMGHYRTTNVREVR